ncbi:MAG TPA: hypothetical protein VM779_16365 [Thermoanaerobaculia bacterium]|nr:hypothetical protein [Thermoanaerobaculia bacterium]
MKGLVEVCLVLAAAAGAQAQGPTADWQTLSTAHFRIHYPKEYEAWSERAASRLESIRTEVVREIGYDPPTPIDVIIANPIAQPNGFAWTSLDTPRIVLYTEPPGPGDEIGAYSSWIDLLAVHEVAHVVHMLRPSRNPTQRLIERILFPLNRITLGAPRWVLEGYATVIEGRLTGSGRPSSTARALILRQWAAHGRLPSYDRLDSDSRFLGMSMAYLAGSAYLEWLEQRNGKGSLRNVWTRMTAGRRRSFDEAFAGVFGDSPERLYGQFTAALTAAAVAANQAVPMREGELWQQTSRRSGAPAVSPDGERIVVVERPGNEPPRLVVWSTGPPETEETRYEDQLAAIRERDPEDVMPVRVKPLRRDPIHSFSAPDGGDLLTPRWTRDGRSILHGRRQPDPDGFLHHDLFLWTPETGQVRRVTHLADVKEADPLPDGRTAVALRTRYGTSQLVLVDLASGGVAPLTEPSLDIVHAHPRADSDGNLLAYVANHGGAWVLVIRDLQSGSETIIEPERGDGFAWPEWRPGRDDLITTVLSRGFMELHRAVPGGRHVPITRTSGGATEAAPSPDGRIFFMSLEPDGFVVRVIDDAEAAAPPPLGPSLIPAVPPAPPVVAPFAPQALPSPEPYGIGRQEISWIVGLNLAPSQKAAEAGIRIGDVIGRLDTIAVASFGDDDAQRGAAVAGAWRGWPVEIAAHLFRTKDHRDDRDGGELRAMWSRQMPRSVLTMEGGVLAGTLDLAFAEGRWSGFRVMRGWRFQHDLEAAYDAGDFRQTRGRIGGSISRGSARLSVAFDARALRESRGEQAIELGGLPSTIVPRSAFSARVLEPALPVASLRGRRYEGRFVEAVVPAIPLTLFYRHHRLGAAAIEVAGGQLTLDTEPLPLIGLPGLEATLGVGRVVSGRDEQDTNWWLGLRWRP